VINAEFPEIIGSGGHAAKSADPKTEPELIGEQQRLRDLPGYRRIRGQAQRGSGGHGH